MRSDRGKTVSGPFGQRGGWQRLALAAALLCAVLLPASLAAGRPGQADGRYGAQGTALLGGDTRLLGAAVQRDGKLVVVGEQGRRAGSVRLLVTRLTAKGKPDRGFRGGRPYLGPVGTSARGVAIQPNGRVVVAGAYSDPAGTRSTGMLLLRLRSNGSPDRSFSGNGFASILDAQSGQALAVALQRDGRIVAVGDATQGTGSDGFPRLAAARFKAGGAPDRSFGQRGAAVLDVGRFAIGRAIAIRRDGRIIIGGSRRDDLQATTVLAARLTSRGQLDRGFAGGSGVLVRQLAEGGGGFSAFNAIALAPGGKIVLAGSATGSGGQQAIAARLTGGGAFDRGFSGDGVARIPATADRDAYSRDTLPGARAVALSGGDVILAGHFDSLGRPQAALWALRGNGALDGRFGQGGRVVFDDLPGSLFDALALAPDGSLLGAGFLNPDPFEAGRGLAARVEGFPVRIQAVLRARRSYKLGPALRKGIAVGVSCNRACRISGVLKAGSVVARGAARLGGTGTRTLKLRFTKAGKRRLAGKARVSARLIVTAKAAGKRDRVTKKIILRR